MTERRVRGKSRLPGRAELTNRIVRRARLPSSSCQRYGTFSKNQLVALDNFIREVMVENANLRRSLTPTT